MNDIDQLKALGAKIREKRLSLELSQEDFAHRAELDRSYVGQIERGSRNLSFSNLSKIAAALELTISQLTDGI